jgi:GNAT superfamily N-acetyltransferase
MAEPATPSLDTPSLRMRFRRAPGDELTVGAPVALIEAIEVLDLAAAATAFEAFRTWCEREGVVLASCRLGQERLLECGFLESRGFRFIELNYRPEVTALQAAATLEGPSRISVQAASVEDESEIAAMAGQVFRAGRFHSDPMIDPRIGDLRYRMWIHNAFRSQHQSVLKCVQDGRTVAFFVYETPATGRRFWSLVGLAPGLGGRGLGSEVWRAVLRWHRDEGVDSVATSISSLNVAVHNLYVKLGFRFPAPEITLHACPRGPIQLSMSPGGR